MPVEFTGSPRTEIKRVMNGDDMVLFLRDPKGQPFTMLPPGTARRGLLDSVLIDPIGFQEGGLLSVAEQRWFFKLWFYSLFFRELFPTKPILAVIGKKGSGKSTTLRNVGRILFGPQFDVTRINNDPKNFDAAVTNSSFVALDNVDNPCSWLEDSLATASSGAVISRRGLYTDNDLKEYPVRAYIGVTSRTPHFTRDDVADRLLPFYVERFLKFTGTNDLDQKLNANRNQIMTEVLFELQKIVAALEHGQHLDCSSGFRLADFANFALKIAHAEGRRREMDSILVRMGGEQRNFSAEGDPLIEMVELWLESNPANQGRKMLARDLSREFSDLARLHRTQWKCDNHRSLAQNLGNSDLNLGQIFEFEKKSGRGNQMYYSFRTRAENEPVSGGRSPTRLLEMTVPP